ncbi:MAG TPA: aldolase/citrate lyase family protein [Burkholderiales bacterium]|nr:aldolase/citrate lyase family protein [Burkholderiales bacterium]
MRESRIRRIVRNGGTAVGMMIMEFGTRGIARILEYADIDYVIIDMEHSGFGMERVADLIAWFKATDIDTIVRVPENLYHYLAGVLDAGASGVQVANIETAEQARAIVQAVKYAPLGNRGLGLTAAHSDFRTPKASDYLPFRNQQTLVIAQVETAKGLENCEEIAAVEGVDSLAVGANDMTFSLGIHGQFEHPLFMDAMKRVIAACQRHGKIGKCHPHHPAQIGEFWRMGYRMMMGNSDVSHLRQGVKATMDNLRRHVQESAAAPSPRS